MRKFLLISAVIAGISGCATNSQYGNFSTAPAAHDNTFASDTVAHLVTIYPPALTRLNIMQPTEDAYGSALVTLLRGRGYAVREYVTEDTNKSKTSTKSAFPGVDLRYVVDSLAPAVDMYRVTVAVGAQTISRAYIPQQNGTVAAAGSWVRKE